MIDDPTNSPDLGRYQVGIYAYLLVVRNRFVHCRYGPYASVQESVTLHMETGRFRSTGGSYCTAS